MKQKSQNRFLAALLAVAMMLQMLPMLAFADDAPDAHAVKIDGKEGSYTKLEDAVTAARAVIPSSLARAIIHCTVSPAMIRPREKT
ncbi:MAG: hypothetical protein V8R60_04080 [Faecalibacterium sp.]